MALIIFQNDFGIENDVILADILVTPNKDSLNYCKAVWYSFLVNLYFVAVSLHKYIMYYFFYEI